VSTEMILTNLSIGISTVKKILKSLIPSMPQKRNCSCASALKYAIVTGAKYIPKRKKKELGLLINKYLPGSEDVNKT
jgi:5'-methylthioadenosine phosphorylase